MTHIDEYLLDEVTAGRMSGPYSRPIVERILRGPFISSPLIISVSSQGPDLVDKIRICRNLSKCSPEQPSVNSFIQKDLFPTRFDTAIRMANILASAPPGTQACTLDIAKFHRTCPVVPSHKPWLVLQGRSDQFYIDHVHPFGAACASSNAGMIANAMVDVLAKLGIGPVPKYEDDLAPMRIPTPYGCYRDGLYSYDYDRAEIIRRVESLGIPWHPEKGQAFFSSVFIFIGFEWNLELKTVSLTELKRQKYLFRVCSFLDSFSGYMCHLNDIQKIHGTLCHVSFVYREGRSRLPSLSNFAASFGDNDLTARWVPAPVVNDLRWWRERLSSPCTIRHLLPLGPTLDPGIFVDASTSWGIGIIFCGKWIAFRLRPGWKSIRGRDIGWLETVAVEFAVYLIDIHKMSSCSIIIHSDNQSTIGAMYKGRSPNTHINLSIRRTYVALSAISVSPSFQYIESALNPADPISRGHPGPPSSCLPLSFPIPEDLLPVLSYVSPPQSSS